MERVAGRMFELTFPGLPVLASIVCVAGQLFVTQMFWQHMTQPVACSPPTSPLLLHPLSSVKVSLAVPFKTPPITSDFDLCNFSSLCQMSHFGKTGFVSCFFFIIICVSGLSVNSPQGRPLPLLLAPLFRKTCAGNAQF